MIYSIGKFSKLIGVTTQTLRNWHKSEELIPCKITKGGTRYYSDEQLSSFLYSDPILAKSIVINAKVFNEKQKKELKDKCIFLRQYCHEFICDIEVDHD